MEYFEAVRRYNSRCEAGRLQVRAALIDMDGVLYDSMRNHTAAWYRMATEMGISCTREEFYLYEGMTGAATINVLFKRAFGRECTPEEAAELYARKARYFSALGEPMLMPGADRMLTTLRDNGIDRVLVTGSGQQSILDRISNDYPDIFATNRRVTAHDVTHGKPDPEPYLKGMQLSGCAAHQSMVIENAPLGVKAGRAAGAFVVGITTGPIPEADMWSAGADLVFPSMPAFADALPALLPHLA